MHMAQLRQDYQKFVEQDGEVIVVGPEKAAAFRSYWEMEELPFVGVPDPDHTVLKRFGQEVNLFKLGRMPAQVLVDQRGVARFAHYGKSMSDIPANKELLALLKKINREAESEALMES
jgi:peroxiredoxin Q/BCP